MGYDSPEDKEKGKELAEKLRKLLEMARDKNFQAQLMKTVDDNLRFVTAMHEKAKYEPLEESEQELLDEIAEKMPIVLQFVQDCKLALGNELLIAADTQYFHVKRLAEQGDPKAKEVYEKLKPLYQDSVRSNMEKLGLN
jgi:hypothetical protein